MKKLMASGMAVVLLYSNVLAGPLAQANFWGERRKTLATYAINSQRRSGVVEAFPSRSRHPLLSSRSSKPAPAWLGQVIANDGEIQDVSLAVSPSPMVLLIQDAHGLVEAQRNIARILQRLIERRGVAFIGLEGSSGRFDLTPFRSLSDQTAVAAIAEYLLKVGLLTGPEVAGLLAQPGKGHEPLLWGLEEPSLYLKNLRAVQEAESLLEWWRGVNARWTNQQRSPDLVLLEKLLNHSLTTSEWAIYQERRPVILKQLERLTLAPPGSSKHVRGEPSWLTPFERFYQIAEARNETLAQNLLAVMAQTRQHTAALVVGGFHTPGLTRRLKAQGISYIVLSPRITRVDQSAHYLAELTRPATPLERLFAGEKLYLHLGHGLAPVPDSLGAKDGYRQRVRHTIMGVWLISYLAWAMGTITNVVPSARDLLQRRAEELNRAFRFVGAGVNVRDVQKTHFGVQVTEVGVPVPKTFEVRVGAEAATGPDPGRRSPGVVVTLPHPTIPLIPLNVVIAQTGKGLSGRRNLGEAKATGRRPQNLRILLGSSAPVLGWDWLTEAVVSGILSHPVLYVILALGLQLLARWMAAGEDRERVWVLRVLSWASWGIVVYMAWSLWLPGWSPVLEPWLRTPLRWELAPALYSLGGMVRRRGGRGPTAPSTAEELEVSWEALMASLQKALTAAPTPVRVTSNAEWEATVRRWVETPVPLIDSKEVVGARGVHYRWVGRKRAGVVLILGEPGEVLGAEVWATRRGKGSGPGTLSLWSYYSQRRGQKPVSAWHTSLRDILEAQIPNERRTFIQLRAETRRPLPVMPFVRLVVEGYPSQGEREASELEAVVGSWERLNACFSRGWWTTAGDETIMPLSVSRLEGWLILLGYPAAFLSQGIAALARVQGLGEAGAPESLLDTLAWVQAQWQVVRGAPAVPLPAEAVVKFYTTLQARAKEYKHDPLTPTHLETLLRLFGHTNASMVRRVVGKGAVGGHSAPGVWVDLRGWGEGLLSGWNWLPSGVLGILSHPLLYVILALVSGWLVSGWLLYKNLARVMQERDDLRRQLQSAERQRSILLELGKIKDARLAGSRTDPLTGLATRLVWDEGFKDLYSRVMYGRYQATIGESQSPEGQEGVIVLFMDVNEFKSINDQRGHDAGDRALQRVAKVLQEKVRPGDLVARYGGDEFVLAATVAEKQVEEYLNQVVKRIRSELDKSTDPVSLSIGVAQQFSLSSAMVAKLQAAADKGKQLDILAKRAEQLVRMADQAMYVAKGSGSGFHVFTSDTLQQRRRLKKAQATNSQGLWPVGLWETLPGLSFLGLASFVLTIGLVVGIMSLVGLDRLPRATFNLHVHVSARRGMAVTLLLMNLLVLSQSAFPQTIEEQRAQRKAEAAKQSRDVEATVERFPGGAAGERAVVNRIRELQRTNSDREVTGYIEPSRSGEVRFCWALGEAGSVQFAEKKANVFHTHPTNWGKPVNRAFYELTGIDARKLFSFQDIFTAVEEEDYERFVLGVPGGRVLVLQKAPKGSPPRQLAEQFVNTILTYKDLLRKELKKKPIRGVSEDVLHRFAEMYAISALLRHYQDLLGGDTYNEETAFAFLTLVMGMGKVTILDEGKLSQSAEASEKGRQQVVSRPFRLGTSRDLKQARKELAAFVKQFEKLDPKVRPFAMELMIGLKLHGEGKAKGSQPLKQVLSPQKKQSHLIRGDVLEQIKNEMDRADRQKATLLALFHSASQGKRLGGAWWAGELTGTQMGVILLAFWAVMCLILARWHGQQEKKEANIFLENRLRHYRYTASQT
ncbi:MAG: GGDEF domain-containing protein [Elusimicrobia bacterium]|nr:GGDEF domain-containing protein [Elusimicrobiota bacterium]